jgi:hypothetical protein
MRGWGRMGGPEGVEGRPIGVGVDEREWGRMGVGWEGMGGVGSKLVSEQRGAA